MLSSCSMTPPKRNIELKANYPDLHRARAALQKLGAVFDRKMSQLDTYFKVPNGRLKLREIDRDHAELIWYHRADAVEFRSSNYLVVPVPDPAAMKSALIAANGLRGEVQKSRELWMYHNVRIHLDQVEHLGSFIEFEAVMTKRETESDSLRRLEGLHTALDISKSDHQAASYSDLLGI